MGFFNSLLPALGKLITGIGVVISLAFGVFSPKVVVTMPPQPPAPHEVATSAKPAPATTTTATSSKPAATAKPAATSTLIKPPVTTTQPASTSPAAPITNERIAEVNTQARLSLVNILCNFRTTNTASYISGSGVMIDPRGVILTNAHVAQFFLLQNYPTQGATSCTIRTGGPAVSAYTAQLLYLPPQWVSDNATQILSNRATGTGERDYAFLYITGATQYAPALPSSYTAFAYSLQSPEPSDPVLLAGYPASFLDLNELQRNLYISSAVSAIGQLYTFNNPNHTDLVSLGGTAVAQSGSSGGAVVNLSTNKLVGIIVTESDGETTAARDLRALTLSYINRSLSEDGKGSIAALLSGDLLKAQQQFNTDIAPAMAKKLSEAIEAQFK